MEGHYFHYQGQVWTPLRSFGIPISFIWSNHVSKCTQRKKKQNFSCANPWEKYGVVIT
jgi:hypothetical protein